MRYWVERRKPCLARGRPTVMGRYLNTLFVTTPRAYLRKDGQAVAVSIEREVRLRVPLHHLDGIAVFGAIGASPALLAACAEGGQTVSFFTESGRFLARVSGFTSGNVLLRRAQYRRSEDAASALQIARSFVIGKLANTRYVLLRGARDCGEGPSQGPLEHAAKRLASSVDAAAHAADLDALRGIEGDAARDYFGVFNALIGDAGAGFAMSGRSRRPPLDPVNALLSFVYAILTHDGRSACEGVGLDPQVGFLHADRPGRPGLALDLIEEFRPWLADRLVLSLINRRQVRAEGFRSLETGAVVMNDETRRAVLVAYQKRKQETVAHPVLGESMPIGLLIHVQARLLARAVRGELDVYPPYAAR